MSSFSCPHFEMQREYCTRLHTDCVPGRPGCVLSKNSVFELCGGHKAGVRFVESTRLAVLAVSLGSVETLVEHPASMSHLLLSDEELYCAGIPPGLIWPSVGIEHLDDLIADLEHALEK